MGLRIGVIAAIVGLVATGVYLFRVNPPQGLEGVQRDLIELLVVDDNLLEDKPRFDLRVSKGFGKRGYNKIRVSAITEGGRVLSDEIFRYKKPFQERWTHAFDMGQPGVGCEKKNALKVFELKDKGEPACRWECGQKPSCAKYSYFNNGTCVLADKHCKPSKMEGANITVSSHGLRTLHSSVIDVEPGVRKKITIDGVNLTLFIPKEDEGTAGIVWADPCVFASFVPCSDQFGFHEFKRSYEFMNALAKHDPTFDFFQILGDNFYDQDGRITRELFDKFSYELKSKLFYTVPGNHDFWVKGTPPGNQNQDQFGHGFMQFYAQDTLGAHGDELFNMTAVPDSSAKTYNTIRNTNDNFLFYNKLGNLGFIGYNGAGSQIETDKFLREACQFFAHGTPPAFIFTMNHWDSPALGCDANMTASKVRERVITFPGCDIGDKVKFMDGHKHCNKIETHGTSEPVGFMIGAHGQANEDPTCIQDGFLYIHSTKSRLVVYYFETSSYTPGKDGGEGKLIDQYPHLLDCIHSKGGLSNCTQYAKVW
eukprot:CAMPEP_0203755536 /NCGR_PEP_ID=MMETSP0098-20131031/8960_1 /ASSEMBLY_ACC=CAM_ASM_000208 /TAXON_ID=96639 /ORGANISM=" , Strain NY0313808BC1" /LENGTH=536 /DNA_ID=CAMNT_0050647025 /DNA_START=114 /DNA_END=1721 /DNA_ORIENTATION=-